MRGFILALTLMSLAACASKQKETQPAVTKVGIVSLFEDDFAVFSLKPNKKEKQVSVRTAGWSMNDAFLSAYDTQLKALKREPIRVNLDSKTVNDMIAEARGLKDIYLGDCWQILTQYVLEQAQKQGADYLIMVHPTSSNTYKEYQAGYGIACGAPMFKKHEAAAYFLMRAELWDVRNRKIQSTSTVTPDQVFSKMAKHCDLLKKTKSDKLSEESKGSFIDMVGKTTDLNLEGLGIKNPLM